MTTTPVTSPRDRSTTRSSNRCIEGSRHFPAPLDTVPDMIETQVLVIGGGATGTAVARDAALRGMDVVLVEKRKDLAEGTTGRFHGLLHSGGRYVVKDPDLGQGVHGRAA